MRLLRRALGGARLAAACGTGLGIFWGGYLTTVGVAADLSFRRRSAHGGSVSTRFRVLVPAHDEERLIGATLDSLKALDYPNELFELHVVADNCGDRTAEIARERGAEVHERHDLGLPGKGAALAWLIDRLPVGESDDAIVVIDADTVVGRDLLSAFSRTFESGAEVIQAYYTVKDADAGQDIGFRAIALAVRHFVRPAGRTAMGGSSSLYGNGMAFRESIARSYRWSNGLTEDLEMGLALLLAGHTVVFAADAVVEAEMPASLEEALSQNERWEAGRLRVAIDHVPRLLGAARRRDHGRRWAYIDAAIDISLPPLTTVLAATAVSGSASVVLSRGSARSVALLAATTAIGSQVAHVLHALRLAEVSPEVRRSLLRTPAHVVWKSGILGRAVRKRPGSWIRTARQSGEFAA